MVEYPCVFDWDGRRYMLYNGNGYGRTGVGLALRGPILDFCLMQKSRFDPAYCREHLHHAVDHELRRLGGQLDPQRQPDDPIAAVIGDGHRSGRASVSHPGRRRVQRHVVKHGVDALRIQIARSARPPAGPVAESAGRRDARCARTTPVRPASHAELRQRHAGLGVATPRARRAAVIRSASSSCAHRNAAISSPGRNDEPTSTQVYLSTCAAEELRCGWCPSRG